MNDRVTKLEATLKHRNRLIQELKAEKTRLVTKLIEVSAENKQLKKLLADAQPD